LSMTDMPTVEPTGGAEGLLRQSGPIPQFGRGVRERLDVEPGRSTCVSISLTTARPGSNGGYGGSGPAQLALAILAERLSDDAMAVRLHQAFK